MPEFLSQRVAKVISCSRANMATGARISAPNHRTHRLQTPAIDCTFAEFESALSHGEVLEERVIQPGVVKRLILTLSWTRPLHAVVVTDDQLREERIITVYEPDRLLWSPDYRRRR